MVDSGAARSVCPKSHAPHVETQPASEQLDLMAASGHAAEPLLLHIAYSTRACEARRCESRRDGLVPSAVDPGDAAALLLRDA